MRLRALRRHNEDRIKRRVAKYLILSEFCDPRRIGIIARSKAHCSCWMCGNPRKHFKQLAIQERRELERID